MKTPRLSICIATYNRATYIGETLDSVIPQVTDDVEIVVVDGASTDGTELLMREYLQRCDRLRYIRLPVKGGVDGDYNRAVESARGEYCWLFTDDDLLKAGAVEKVLHELLKGHALMVINSEVWNADFSSLISARHLSDEARPVYAPDAFDDFFRDCVRYLSYIGAVVIRKSIWDERDKESYLGTDFIHVGVIFQKRLPMTIGVIQEPCIQIRYGNAQWTVRKFDIWMHQWPRLLWSFDEISQAAKHRIIDREPWKNLKKLFVYRSLAAYDATVLRKLISQHPVSSSWRLAATCISRFPVGWAGRILLHYYALSGKPKDLIYADLLEMRK